MEALERAFAREAQRLPSTVLEPVNIRSLDDILKVVSDLAPSPEDSPRPVKLDANISVRENGRSNTYSVSANTTSKTKRQMILDTLKVLKNRHEVCDNHANESQPIVVNGKQVKPLTPFMVDSRMAIDGLISHWTGGERRGEMIYWTLPSNDSYKYDIWAHKLYKVS